MRARVLSRVARLTLAAIMVTSMMAVVVPGVSAAPTTYYVDPVNGTDAPGGTTEGTAFKTVDYALGPQGAVDGDTIMCLPGTYSASTNGEDFPLNMVPGVALVSKMGAEVTILDNEGDDYTGSMLVFDNPIYNSIVEGFSIINGADGTGDPVIDVDRWDGVSAPGSPKIVDNIFTSHEDIRQPVIQLDDAENGWLQPYIAGNEFCDIGEEGEQAPDQGAAIEVGEWVDVTIEDNYFHDIYVDGPGAIYVTAGPSKLEVAMNYFTEIYSASNGAAICLDGAGGSGSAIEAVVRDNMFSNTYSESDGGAIYLYRSEDVAIARNVISDAYAEGDGGALYSAECTATLENNIIFSNQCDADGGAMYINDTVMDFVNNTVNANSATNSSDFNGIYIDGGGPVDIVNSIIGGHSGEDVWNATSVTYSCTESTIAGTGNIHTYPMFFDESSGDFRLELGSPCIDTANGNVSPDEDLDHTSRPQDGDGDGVAEDDMGAWEKPGVIVGRNAGSTRYATAAEMAMDVWGDSQPDTAVIVSGENFPDAISAAGLCGSYEAPLLLTKTASLPSVTANALKDLEVQYVFIVGGEVAVSSAVEDTLKADYNVTRIAGSNRYATSAMVAKAMSEHDGSDSSQRAFIARGDEFPDALTVSPYAYSDVSPILLTRSTDLPGSISAVITSLDIEDAYVCGGTTAISEGVMGDVDTLLKANGGSASERWAGVNRYATAATIASKATAAGYATYDYVRIATGENFPDALAGGVVAGVDQGVVLLTRADSLSGSTAAELNKRKAQVVYCDILGGELAVTAGVKTAVETALGW